MKIVFFGDSITDAGWDRKPEASSNSRYGYGYVMQIAGRLFEKSPVDYEIVNAGISGNRVVDLYARIKKDVWNEKPDVLSIFIGVNDIWHEVERKNGVEPDRFERIYRMLLDDTIARLPDTKIILCSPFALKGKNTEAAWEAFSQVTVYIDIVERIAKDYGLYYVPLQGVFEKESEKYGNSVFLRDGVHPSVQGAVLLANEWLKVFEKLEKGGK